MFHRKYTWLQKNKIAIVSEYYMAFDEEDAVVAPKIETKSD